MSLDSGSYEGPNWATLLGPSQLECSQPGCGLVPAQGLKCASSVFVRHDKEAVSPTDPRYRIPNKDPITPTQSPYVPDVPHKWTLDRGWCAGPSTAAAASA